MNFILLSISTYLIGNIYSKLWKYFKKESIIPSGFGYLLIFIIFLTFFFSKIDFNDNRIIHFILFLILIATLYFFDDLYGLPAILRFILQFLLGSSSVYFLLTININNFGFFEIIIIFGILSIFFSNVINFYDGLDLNLSVLMFIGLLLSLIFNQDTIFINNLIFFSLSFIIGFSFLNLRPQTLYFGDSGCFMYTAILFTIILSNLNIGNYKILLVLSSLALPSLDLIYVNFYRIYLGENLLSRNYHYLYQKAFAKYRNYSYLFLQPLNMILILICGYLVNMMSVPFLISYVISSIIMTVIFYFIVRFYIIK